MPPRLDPFRFLQKTGPHARIKDSGSGKRIRAIVVAGKQAEGDGQASLNCL